jgi:predicted ATPase/DNA-binding CsgD family transcriptional regulator
MPKSSASQGPLKKREVEILQLTSQGMTKSEIAITLMLAVETVAWYGRQILKKLEVENWDEALTRGIELGLIAAPVLRESMETEDSVFPAEKASINEPVDQTDEPAGQEQQRGALPERSSEIPMVILPGVMEALAPPVLLAEPSQPAESRPIEAEANVPVHPTAEFEAAGPLPTFDEVGITDSTIIAPATYSLSDEFDLAGAIPPNSPTTQTHPPQFDHELLSALAASSSHLHHEDIDDDWNLKSLSTPSNDLLLFDTNADDTGVFGPTEAVPEWGLFSPNAAAKGKSVADEPTRVAEEEIEREYPSSIEDEAAPKVISNEHEETHTSEQFVEKADNAVRGKQDYTVAEEVDDLPVQAPSGIPIADERGDFFIAAEEIEPAVERRAYRPARNLPVPTGVFIGREREMRELKQLLVGLRVVHLTGYPGVGKTRLALETANQLRDEFAGGVHYLYLPSVTQPALQSAVALHLVGNSEAQPAAQGKSLLILDHADRTSRLSTIITELLSRQPDLRIIVTSRDWMGIKGEAELKVLPLGVPSIHPRKAPNWSSLLESTAMRLFVRVTEQALPGYSLRESDAIALGHLCERSQGIPALIEILAAHLRVYPPPIILMQLDNRLRGLGGVRSDPSIQQSLNGVLGWSHNLLKRDEQLALAGLSLFIGGWTAETAAAALSPFVKSSMDEILKQLTHKRFIQVLSTENENKRYTMSDAIRDFATAKLQQHELYSEIIRAFAGAFWGMIEDFGSDQKRRLPSLEAEIDNIRSVLRLAAEYRATEMLTRTVLGLWPLWETTDRYKEADYWFNLALALPGQKAQDTQNQIRLMSASVALRRGDHQQALKLLEECLVVYRLSGDHANERHILSLLRQIMIDHPDEQTNL